MSEPTTLPEWQKLYEKHKRELAQSPGRRLLHGQPMRWPEDAASLDHFIEKRKLSGGQ